MRVWGGRGRARRAGARIECATCMGIRADERRRRVMLVERKRADEEEVQTNSERPNVGSERLFRGMEYTAVQSIRRPIQNKAREIYMRRYEGYMLRMLGQRGLLSNKISQSACEVT